MPFSFINVFGLFFKIKIGIKKSLVWKPNHYLTRTLIPLFYVL